MTLQELRDAYNAVKNSPEYDPHVNQYVFLDAEDSCLDGDFTSAELRRIADLMDRLANTPEFQAYHKAYLAIYNAEKETPPAP